jgi:2-oxoisovalerate dehydrogenase E1 component
MASHLEAIGLPAVTRMIFFMHVVRAFELTLLDACAAGKVPGPVHSSIGQEGVAAAVLDNLRDGDEVVGNHRSHHHFLTQALRRLVGADWDPIGDALPKEGVDVLTRTFSEILGRAAGVNSGVGGSMHLRNAVAGFAGSSAIVGGGMPIAAGLAFAHRQRGTGGLAVCFVGDGAVNQGVFHETANLAAVLRVPLLVVVENNGYAESTRPEDASAVLPLASQGSAHGLASYRAPGNDVLALHRVAQQATAAIRTSCSPALVEVETYRHLDHTGGERGSAAGYRTAAEEQAWLSVDPLFCLPSQLDSLGLVASDALDAVAEAARTCVTTAWAAVGDAEDDEQPFAPLQLLRGPEPAPVAPSPESHRPARAWTFRDAIAQGLASALRDRPETVLIGEEVGRPGGILAAAGLLESTLREVGRHRIIDTPICEASFVGLAGGAAMAGLRPIVELMYGSFSLVAADQLFNHIGLIRALYGNTAEAPVIIRTKVPYGRGYGPQHGLNPVGLFALFPGWRVYAPADPASYLGVFNASLECRDPVLIVEFTSLYEDEQLLTDNDFAARGPMAGLRCLRRGRDLSIVTYGLGVRWALAAADQLAALGHAAEILDLHALDSLSADRIGLRESLGRTGHGLFVDPSARSQAIGPRLIAELAGDPGRYRMAFLACEDIQPVGRSAEQAAIIGPDDVVDAALDLIGEGPQRGRDRRRPATGVRNE